MQQRNDERSLGELFADLSRELTTLVRQEMQLATTEMGGKAARVGRHVGMLAVGGAVVYAGFLAFLAAIIVGLVELTAIPWWVSALVVGLVVAVIGYFLVRRGLTALKAVDLAPKQTIETLKEDKEWIQEQMR